MTEDPLIQTAEEEDNTIKHTDAIEILEHCTLAMFCGISFAWSIALREYVELDAGGRLDLPAPGPTQTHMYT